jgi:hypothetical protein
MLMPPATIVQCLPSVVDCIDDYWPLAWMIELRHSQLECCCTHPSSIHTFTITTTNHIAAQSQRRRSTLSIVLFLRLRYFPGEYLRLHFRRWYELTLGQRLPVEGVGLGVE